MLDDSHYLPDLNAARCHIELLSQLFTLLGRRERRSCINAIEDAQLMCVSSFTLLLNGHRIKVINGRCLFRGFSWPR